MPQGDRTGPDGQGPMTGRGTGFCAGANAPGFANSSFGRGFGRGLGYRQGFGRGFRFTQKMPIQKAQSIPQIQPTVITEKQEKQFLEQELSVLKEDIKEIEKRLKELKV